MKLHSMWDEYPDLAHSLTETSQLMNEKIVHSDQEIVTAILEMMHSGGKMLRPAFCLLFSQFGPNQDHKKFVALAAALETLHTATLIHDDIIDDSNVRRGLPTIQSRFGKDVAVYAGDYLFILCFKMLAQYASDLKSVQLNSASIENILTGELSQMSRRYDYDITIDQYLSQVSGKTAELFGLSAFVGAYESGCSDRFSQTSREIGLEIGLAFQILDDILDYDQSAEAFGKPVLEDVKQGIYSAPLILAMGDHRPEFLPYLQKETSMTDADTKKIDELVEKYHGVEKAQQLAEEYTQKALKKINKFKASATKTTLLRLTNQLLNRRD